MTGNHSNSSDFERALAQTAQEFAQARTLPGRVFWDPDLYSRELNEIFRKHWLCVGHRSRLEKPGDYFVVDIGDESVIVTRNDKSEPRAFMNVCRHRGTRICNASAGHARGFRCPYHAWHYDLDGRLRGAPYMEDVRGFDVDDYPLLPVAIDEFLGFLFLNLAEDAMPLADVFADFPDLSRYRIPELERIARHTYDVPTNWKLVCENYHECYHCPTAHPQLHRISHHGDLSNEGFSGAAFIGGPMAIRDSYSALTKDGTTRRIPFPGCSDDDLRTIHYFNLLPNFLLSVAPDYVLTHHIWPRGPGSVFIESEWFFAPEQLAHPDFDANDAVEFWDETNRQDWELCENALRGLRSTKHVPGRYQPSEDCTHRFDRWYVSTMFPDLR